MASSIASIDTDLEEMHNNIGELKKQVEVIHGGWERLTQSNTELSSQMATIVQSLSGMEDWQRADKAAGKAVAGTSSHQDQVHPSIPVPIVGEHPLGYRGIANNLESRSELLKKVDFPNFVGANPNVWINRAERFFRLGNFTERE